METEKLNKLKVEIEKILYGAYDDFADSSKGFWVRGEMKVDGYVADKILEKVEEIFKVT